MGLFLVKERTKQGSAIGGPERFQGMAILLDSYKNGGTTGNFPLVSFSFSFTFITVIFSKISGFVSNGTWDFNHDTDGADQNIGKCLSGHRNKQKSSLLRIR